MKSWDAALRLKRFEADEKSRKVSDLEYMVREFEQMADDLDRQITAEEDRTGIKDKAHYAYSTFAKSAMERRDNLMSSVEELREKLTTAEKERDDALESLSRSTSAESRETNRNTRRASGSSNAAMR